MVPYFVVMAFILKAGMVVRCSSLKNLNDEVVDGRKRKVGTPKH